jgi:hypothetical protein
MDEHKDFDVVQLTSHVYSQYLVPCDDLVKYSRKSCNAAGYIVNAHFYDKLISCWENALKMAKEGGPDWIHICDQSWQSLQTDKWFAFIPVIGYQRPSFSDLAHKHVDLHGILQPISTK